MSEHELAVFFWTVLVGQAIGLVILGFLVMWLADREIKKNGKTDKSD